MKRFAGWILLAGAALLAAACGGGGNGLGSGGSLNPPQRPLVVRRHRAIVKFSIKVPPCTGPVRCRHARRAHFVSPATSALQVSIDNGTPTIFNISLSSSLCWAAGAGAIACTIAITTTSGPHHFTFIALDSSNNKLSAALNVPFTVPAGVPSVTIPVTLGGIPAGITILPPNAPQVTGTAFNGFTVYGTLPQAFSAIALDADGNYMLGPGAPVPVMTMAPGIHATLSVPPSASPNQYTLTSSYVPKDPSVPSTFTLTAVIPANPYTGQTVPVTAGVNFSLYTPWIFVTNNATGKVTAYDEQGNQKSLGTGFAGTIHPVGIAYDSHDNVMLISDTTGQSLRVYSVLGGARATTGMPTPAPGAAFGLAYDSQTSLTYAALNSAGTIVPYDANLTPGVLPYSPTIPGPICLAYDPTDSLLFVTSFAGTRHAINAMNANGMVLATTFNPVNQPFAVAYDDPDGLVLATDLGDRTVRAWTAAGALVPTAFPTIPAPGGILYDPHDGIVYVSDISTNTISAFDPLGGSIPLSGAFANLSTPTAMTVVP